MDNPYLRLRSSEGNIDDDLKTKTIIRMLQQTKRPLFMEAHFMGTHGRKYFPMKQVFSAAKSIHAQGEWDQDFYDDCIVEFDRRVGEIIQALESESPMNDTLLIIGSDHGQEDATTHRLPLLFHFPHGKYAGRIKANVQNLDIAPTILDYLGVPKPAWMQGQSLISGALPDRAIFGVIAYFDIKRDHGVIEIINKRKYPPFYQFGRINLVQCDSWYSLKLKTNKKWETGKIAASTNACTDQRLLSESAALQLMISYLNQNKFDTSSLEDMVELVRKRDQSAHAFGAAMETPSSAEGPYISGKGMLFSRR
jgi:hypothetical protein